MSVSRTSILRNLSSIPGWTSGRKIVVLESDDWGSLGTPSVPVYQALLSKGVYREDEAAHYYRYDTLESNGDMEGLFEVLGSVTDAVGRHPVFTGYCVVANPDFEAIEEDGFRNYHYQPLHRILEGDATRDRVLELWREGVNRRLFIPQFHGREHLNVAAWTGALQRGAPLTMEAFRHGVFGIDPVATGECRVQYRAAFDLEDGSEIPLQEEVIRDGTRLFRSMMGYAPSVFIPPNGPLNLLLEKTLLKGGIRYLVLDKLQREPLGHGRTRTRIRFPGRKNKLGQYYLSRNASFEPSSGDTDWVGSCLTQVETAFRWKKPATISTHRVNYTGAIDPGNRSRGLATLKKLLESIMKRWPDTEFLSTGELGDLISGYRLTDT